MTDLWWQCREMNWNNFKLSANQNFAEVSSDVMKAQCLIIYGGRKMWSCTVSPMRRRKTFIEKFDFTSQPWRCNGMVRLTLAVAPVSLIHSWGIMSCMYLYITGYIHQSSRITNFLVILHWISPVFVTEKKKYVSVNVWLQSSCHLGVRGDHNICCGAL